MVLDWSTGRTKAQYFVINPETYQSLKWSILKHSYHTYQLPGIFHKIQKNGLPSIEVSLAHNRWKNHCNVNINDFFSKSSTFSETETNRSKTAMNDKNDLSNFSDDKQIKKQQKLIDRFSARLYKLFTHEKSESQYRKLEDTLRSLNSALSFVSF